MGSKDVGRRLQWNSENSVQGTFGTVWKWWRWRSCHRIALLDRQLPEEHRSFKGRAKTRSGRTPAHSCQRWQPALAISRQFLEAAGLRARRRRRRPSKTQTTETTGHRIQLIVSNMWRLLRFVINMWHKVFTVSNWRKPGTCFRCGALDGRKAWIGEEPAGFPSNLLYQETLHQTEQVPVTERL